MQFNPFSPESASHFQPDVNYHPQEVINALTPLLQSPDEEVVAFAVNNLPFADFVLNAIPGATIQWLREGDQIFLQIVE